MKAHFRTVRLFWQICLCLLQQGEEMLVILAAGGQQQERAGILAEKYGNTFLFIGYVELKVDQYVPFVSHTLHTHVHFLAGGVVEELHLRLALLVRPDVGIPVDGASEVRHRWDDVVVLRLEGGGGVEALKVGAADALIAFGGEFNVSIKINPYCPICLF